MYSSRTGTALFATPVSLHARIDGFILLSLPPPKPGETDDRIWLVTLWIMIQDSLIYRKTGEPVGSILRSKTVTDPAGKGPLKNGAGEENRTPDRLITNQLLYLLSYASLDRIRGCRTAPD